MADFTPQQLEAITTIDKNVAVSAGAGSGKTRVLVERYLHILKQGLLEPSLSVTAGEILAITFTRKAAAEMKERVRKSMHALSRSDADGRYFWKQQLKELEKAQITTIHSLCNRILKENPVEAALDPSFQVVEEFEGQSFLEKCIKRYFRTELRRDNAALQLLLKNYGVQNTLRQLYTLVPKFAEITAYGDLKQSYLNGLKAAAADKEILCSKICELIERRTELKKSKMSEQLQLAAENLQDILDGIRQEPPDYTAYDSYIGCLKKVSALKDMIGDIKEVQQRLLYVAADKQGVQVAAAWQQVIAELADYILQKKISGDFLTFDDLENLALQLLQKNEHICRKYQSKFRYIMVDEFQDTNEKQKQLVYLLCGGDAQQLKNNKLFIVGDPKQSIYRFRGADVSVFAAVRKDIKANGGREITLADNFRTVDVILEACNEVFSRLLGEDKESDIYFEALAAHHNGMEKPLFLQLAYDKETKAYAGEAEAMAVAEEILSLHESGTAFGEMAVLLSAMTRCVLFTQVFDKYGVPYQVIDGKGFYEQQEVLDALNLFAVLHNKKRSLELAGVLRSPYFGLDDETITELFVAAKEQCLWDMLMSGTYVSSKKQQERLLRAAEVLTTLRRKASVLPLPELWAEVWSALHLEAVLALQENGQSRLANVKKLRQLAVDFAAAKQGTLAAWLEYTENIISMNGRETAANIDAEDAVTIMTIHKSKGLEFDTVFLPQLAARTQGDTDEIKFDLQSGLGIKVLMPDGQLAVTSVLTAIRERDKELKAAEKHRQLYVAMTRAKRRLILAGAYDDSRESKSENWFKALQLLLPETAAEIRKLRVEDYLEKEIVRYADGKTEPAFAEAFLQSLPDFEQTGSSEFSASSLQTYLYCQRQYFYRYITQLPPLEVEADATGAAQLPAQIRGLVVHAALEKYTGNAEAAWKTAVEDYADNNFALAKSAEKLFYQYLDSALFQEIPARHQRELKFAYNEQGYTVKGIMDCLYENEDSTLTVVDYKTGQPPAADEIKLGYMLQLSLYKQAAERLLRKKVSSAQLHFLQNLSCVELTGSEDYLAQAVQLFAEISGKKSEQDFACQLASCVNCPYNYLCPQK